MYSTLKLRGNSAYVVLALLLKVIKVYIKIWTFSLIYTLLSYLVGPHVGDINQHFSRKHSIHRETSTCANYAGGTSFIVSPTGICVKSKHDEP